jgi:hypothetical protein
MAKTVYDKIALNGGAASALDGIDGALLLDGDVALVTVSNVLYVYILDDDAGGAEASPGKIIPDANAGNKRWLLQAFNAGTGTLVGDHIGESTAGHGVAVDGLTIKDAGFALGSDADGDMYYRAAGILARLAKGTARQALLMNPGATAPEWAASLASLLAAAGDIPYASAANTPAALAKGTTLQMLRMNAAATAPEWAVNNAVGGDATAGRVLRSIYILVENGTTASCLKCSTISKWNGDDNGVVDNVAKNATTGIWALNAGGTILTLLNTGLSGNAVGVLACHLNYNASGTFFTIYATVSGLGITMAVYNATTGAALDMTTLVDTGVFQIDLLYVTSA